jgi:hypothetical protein
LCFNVIYPTVWDMLGLAIVLATAGMVGVWLAVLVREGFRQGDRPGDARVWARALAASGPGAPGRWVEVTIDNPSASTALVALSVERARRAWLGATAQRHTARRRARLSLGERSVGAVPARASGEFCLWAEGDPRRLRLVVAVGTSGRLRLHRLPLPPPPPPGAGDPGVPLPDPRTPAVS